MQRQRQLPRNQRLHAQREALQQQAGAVAQPNFGDCFAAALAGRDRLQLAFVGSNVAAAGL
ncbi:MAG: hypothetical protein KGO47_05220 [Cyanobacteria bacterium REEB417]|nr:hypothetical protein [Cyanobacteria bacterium REEB417]